MSTNFIQIIEQELLYLIELKKYLESKLLTLPQGTLRCRTQKNKTRFLIVNNGNERYVSKADVPLAKELLAHKFESERLQRVSKNIIQLTSLKKNYLPHDAGTIFSSLTLAYQKAHLQFSGVPAVIVEQDPAKTWAEAPYETNPYLPEEKKHIVSGGLRVRSKSEALIAEFLQMLGIPFRYEAAL